MTQPNSAQAPRCDCCGEFLGPEHVGIRARLEMMENRLRESAFILQKLATYSVNMETQLKELERHLDG